jgi:two-component SAPR family response regulator
MSLVNTNSYCFVSHKPVVGWRHIFTLLACLLAGVSLRAQQLSPAGLSFFSNDRPISERTQYDVLDGYKEIYGTSLDISFELSVIDPDYFGHIMDLFSRSGEEFNIVLVNFRDKENVYVDFNETYSGIKLSFPIPRSECRDGHWHTVGLSLDFLSGTVTLTINDSSQRVTYPFKQHKREVKCILGRSAKYTDVPRMAVRNLKYTDSKNSFYFPLNETKGESVHDVRGKSIGHVEHPQWLTNCHYHWKNEADFWQSGVTYIAHDPIRHKIIGYSLDSTFVYNVGGNKKLVCKENGFTNRFEPTSGGLFFNRGKENFILYNTRPHRHDSCSVAMFDYIEGELTPLDLAVAPSKLHHHTAFTDTLGKDIYIFGGYGHYRYSGEVYRYSVGSHSWKEEHFSGDPIAPRFFAATGSDYKGAEPGIVYLFGGFGNNSGKQEDGARNFYDFYRIDVDGHHVTKLFDMPLSDSLDFVPAGELLVTTDQHCFYVFGYDHNAPQTKGYLYRIGMDGQSIQRVSSGIDIVSEKIESQVYLFYDDFYQKIICVTHELVQGKGTHINIYTLAFPPAIPQISTSEGNLAVWWVIGILGVALLMAGTIVVIRRRQLSSKKAMLQESEEQYDETTPFEARHPQANSVWLLGDFSVFDRDAREITYRFSAKIRQLFLLVLLNSGEDAEGVSSAEISATLWPDKEDSKNIRGVTFKALRDILADLDGLSLIYENRKWRIEIDPSVCTCDYTIIMNTKPSSQLGDPCYAQEPTELLMRGEFLHSNNYKWADVFKLRFEEHVERLILPLLDVALSANDYPQVYKLANTLQLTHPLNEEYIKIQLKALKSMGKHSQALDKYKLFAEEYRKSYGVEPQQELFLGNF